MSLHAKLQLGLLRALSRELFVSRRANFVVSAGFGVPEMRSSRSSWGRGRLHEIAQRRHQRLQSRFIAPPALDRTVVDRFSDLLSAECPDGRLPFIEFEAGWIPGQPDEFNQLAGLAFEIPREPLITEVIDLYRQDLFPMLHK